MTTRILKCEKCNTYTMKEKCSVCNTKTINSKPQRYSATDKYGEYRRKTKKLATKSSD